MKIKTKFNINGYSVGCRNCTLKDQSYVLNLLKKTIFPFVARYYKPNIKMFNDRFCVDYKERKILLRGKRRIGYFQVSKGANKLHITGLFLSPFYQGRGIAKHLMKYFEEIANKDGLSKIELSVWDNNPAVSFYKKCGFKIKAKKDHKYTMVKSVA